MRVRLFFPVAWGIPLSWVKLSSLGSAQGRALSGACALAAVFFLRRLLALCRCVEGFGRTKKRKKVE